MRAAIYARVSTDDQNPENQIAELRSYAEARKFTVVGVYEDVVTTNMERRKSRRCKLKYNYLMEDAAKRAFDVVLVWKYDRFARSVVHLAQALKYFDSLGIAFVSASQSLDTSTASGRMVFNILATFAEYEREVIVERTKLGLKRARREGKVLGPHFSKKETGTTYGVPRPPKVDDAAKRQMVEMYLAGCRVADMAVKLGITVRHANRILSGIVCRLKFDYVTGARWIRRS